MKTKLLVLLLVAAGCEFGVERDEWSDSAAVPASSPLYSSGVPESPASQVTDGAPNGIAESVPAEVDGKPDATSRTPCARVLSNGIGGFPCLPAPQTGDKSHGDPQPWQPSPVPQPY